MMGAIGARCGAWPPGGRPSLGGSARASRIGSCSAILRPTMLPRCTDAATMPAWPRRAPLLQRRPTSLATPARPVALHSVGRYPLHRRSRPTTSTAPPTRAPSTVAMIRPPAWHHPVTPAAAVPPTLPAHAPHNPAGTCTGSSARPAVRTAGLSSRGALENRPHVAARPNAALGGFPPARSVVTTARGSFTCSGWCKDLHHGSPDRSPTPALPECNGPMTFSPIR